MTEFQLRPFIFNSRFDAHAESLVNPSQKQGPGFLYQQLRHVSTRIEQLMI
jgi:hypothetical protein